MNTPPGQDCEAGRRWHSTFSEKSPNYPPTATASVKHNLMPLDYLRKIQHAEFPLRVDDHKEIDCVAVLLAAGLVAASISKPVSRPALDDLAEYAIVDGITVLGRVALSRKRE